MKTKILITSLFASLVVLWVSFAQTTSSDIDQTTSPVAPMMDDSTNAVSDDSLDTIDSNNSNFAEPAIDDTFDTQSSPIWPEGPSDYPTPPKWFGAMIAVMGGIWLLFVWLGIAWFVFWIVMLIDVIQHQEKDKALWVIVIVLGNSIGAIVYYFAARKPRLAAMQTTQWPVVAPTPPSQIPQ
jgi:Phospholipase_D-nuclease N-terminal